MAPFGSKWTRPSSVPFPETWRRFKGLRPMPDGRVPDFWIQDAPEDMADEMADHFCEYFAKDETLTKSMKYNDELSRNEEFRDMIRNCVKERMTVAAFTTWPDGERRLVGANALFVMKKGDSHPVPKNETYRRGFKLVSSTMERMDVPGRYGVDIYTSAVGLSVARAFRGQDLGVQLLKARLQLTRAVGVRLSVNLFTGAGSQMQAERAGFRILAMGRYADLEDDDGSPLYPHAEWPVYQFRFRLIADGDDLDK